MKKIGSAAVLAFVPMFLISVGCTKRNEIDENDSRGAKPLMNKVDRFKLVQLGSLARDQLLLDTITGRVWRAVCSDKPGKNGLCPVAWQLEQDKDLRALAASSLEEFIEGQDK